MSNTDSPQSLLTRYSKELVLLVDTESLQIAGASPELVRRLGFLPDSLIGMPVTDLESGLVSAVFWDQVKAGTHVEAENIEVNITCRDGGELPVSKTIKRIEEAGKNWFIVWFEDISEVKQTESRFSRLSSQLKATLEATGDGLLVLDSKDNIVNMNHRFSEMWEMPRGVFGLDNRGIIKWMEEQMVAPTPAFTVGEEADDPMQQDDFQLLELNNGKVFELRKRLQITGDLSSGCVLSFHDISHRIDYERELIQARENAERANQVKNEFLSNMSHELRTPLNSIMGFSQLIAMNKESGEEAKAGAAEIFRAGQLLLNLINDILDIAKIEAGALSVDIDKVSLKEVFTDIKSLVQPMGDAHNISINFPSTDIVSGVHLLADEVRLKQILLNFISNAIKYNVSEGKVTIKLVSLNTCAIRIQVDDTGPGIAPESIEKLFIPFDRLGAEKKAIEGTGIGLSIAKSLAEMMSGSVGVSSVVDSGTSFWLDMPLYQRKMQ